VAIGTFLLSVVVAWVTGPQSLVYSLVVQNSGVVVSSAKVQPLLVSTVAVVDILLILGCRFLWVFLVESPDEIRGAFKVMGGIPGVVGVMETSPLDSILDLVSLSSEVENFFYFPLLLFLDENGGWWRLVVSGDRFDTSCGFAEVDMEVWVDFDSGRQVQLIGA